MTHPLNSRRQRVKPPRQTGRVGRPPKFDKSFVHRVENYSHLGLTEEEMSHCLDVSYSTFKLWKAAHPELSAAIKRGGTDATAHVARAMYLNAIGYEVSDDKIFVNAKGDVTKVRTIKRFQPDKIAGIFYLKNKDPSRWKDKHEVEAGDELKKLVNGWMVAAKRISLGGDILDGEIGDAASSTQQH